MDCTRSLISKGGRATDVSKTEAFNATCDLLILFGAHLKKQRDPLVRQLVCRPDHLLQELLNEFVQQHVFFKSEQEDSDDGDRALLRKRNHLAAYCKLIVCKVIPVDAAINVFKHFGRCYKDFGDIIKVAINTIRDRDKMKCAEIMQRSLQILYNELAAKDGKVFYFCILLETSAILCKR